MESNVQFMPRSSHYNKHKIWTNKRNRNRKWNKTKENISGSEFGELVDEVEVELRAEGLGIRYRHLMILSLLFLDDITITSLDMDQLKNMLSVLGYVHN